MGLIRVLLAISVVLSHSGPFMGLRMVGGGTAVEAFFMVSGFYMGLILNEKYNQPSDWRLFLTNRLLRILPLYWLMLVLHLALVLGWIAYNGGVDGLLQLPFGRNVMLWVETPLDVLTGAVLAVANGGILLISELYFFAVEGGALVGASDYRQVVVSAKDFVMLPHAWSLDVEIVFYLLVPLVARRRPLVLGLVVVLCIAMRMATRVWVEANVPSALDAVLYFFMPAQLIFFVLGLVAYRLYRRFGHRVDPRLGWGAVAFLAVFTLIFDQIPLPGAVVSKLYYGSLLLLLPMVFVATRTARWDGMIGELSYPVYLCHVTVVVALGMAGFDVKAAGPLAVVCSVVVGAVLTVTVGSRIERLRQWRFRHAPGHAG